MLRFSICVLFILIGIQTVLATPLAVVRRDEAISGSRWYIETDRKDNDKVGEYHIFILARANQDDRPVGKCQSISPIERISNIMLTKKIPRFYPCRLTNHG